MPWIEPKTNWKATDSMEYEDWLRITGNLQHLKDVYYIPGRWRSMDIPGGKNGRPTTTIVTNLEENLTLVRNYVKSLSMPEYEAIQWYAKLDPKYLRNPNFSDFNRWEQITWNMYRILRETLISGTFFAGKDRTVQKLSRSRVGLNAEHNIRRNDYARRNFG